MYLWACCSACCCWCVCALAWPTVTYCALCLQTLEFHIPRFSTSLRVFLLDDDKPARAIAFRDTSQPQYTHRADSDKRNRQSSLGLGPWCPTIKINPIWSDPGTTHLAGVSLRVFLLDDDKPVICLKLILMLANHNIDSAFPSSTN